MSVIRSVDHLRRIIPEPNATASAKILDHIEEQSVAFLALSPFLVMSTSGPDGVELSPKGDEPGFVMIEDARTLLIPERKGNQLALGLQNIIANPAVGLMAFRPRTTEVLRISGRAELLDDPELCARFSVRGKPAVLAIRIHVERAFFHCARSLYRAKLWDPDSWPDPMRVSFGRIIAQSLQNDALEVFIDGMQDNYGRDI